MTAVESLMESPCVQRRLIEGWRSRDPSLVEREGSTLCVEGLSAGYDHDIFRDVKLLVMPGETVRIAGANAAGKSTLMRCLAGVHKSRTGQIVVCRADLGDQPEEAKRHSGYSTGQGPFTYLTGREHIKLAIRVYRLPKSAEQQLVARFPNWAVVRDIDCEVRRYSHGMRQQLAAMLAVVHDPCVLLLDEAIDGFDDSALSDWSNYLAERARRGGSLVYVEHRVEVAAAFPPARNIELSHFQPSTKNEETQ
jgi:ABC-2 type transport system ATP-binding protein